MSRCRGVELASCRRFCCVETASFGQVGEPLGSGCWASCMHVPCICDGGSIDLYMLLSLSFLSRLECCCNRCGVMLVGVCPLLHPGPAGCYSSALVCT